MSIGPSKNAMNPKYERWRRRIFAVTWLTYIGFYFTRKSFSVAKVGMRGDMALHLDKAVLGAIDAAYLIAYAIGQFVCGIAGDKCGVRKVVSAGMLVSIMAGFAMGASSAVLLFGIFWFANGLAQSSGWAPLTKNVGCWFSRPERGRTYGWWCTNYAIGGLIASPFAGYVADHFHNWRFAFFAPSLVLLGILILFLVGQRDKPEDVGLCPVEEYHGQRMSETTMQDGGERETEGSWRAITAALKNPTVLLLGFVYFFLKPTRYLILLWGPVLVNEKLGTGMGASGLISALFEAAGPLGVLLSGYASDKLFGARRIPVCVISLVFLSLVLFGFNRATHAGSPWCLGLMLFSIGFFLFGPDSLIVGTAAVDFGTKKGASTAAGLINSLGSIGAIFGGYLPGVLSQRYGWDLLFTGLAITILFAAVLLMPKWNAVPAREA